MINLSRRADAVLPHDPTFATRTHLRSVDWGSVPEQGAHRVSAQSSYLLTVSLPPVHGGRAPRSSV